MLRLVGVERGYHFLTNVHPCPVIQQRTSFEVQGRFNFRPFTFSSRSPFNGDCPSTSAAKSSIPFFSLIPTMPPILPSKLPFLPVLSS
mmetsp:Transcript_23908/g.49299  ORF Transcript_23908/g.49299 Transcript_23908/m.49299 type:complete len:88 (-) Transcript_23908:342-605(-)